MKICILAGGAGYIGTKLCERFISDKLFDKVIVVDICDPKLKVEGVEYFKQDVRNKISLTLPDGMNHSGSWFFNLAAVHREPGHDPQEYFDTNIKGATHVNEFLAESGISNLFFTSSIAPYGRSREMRDETSACYPETPYGISKWKAESIHEIWLRSGSGRRLVICRPSVIYGPGDPGNVLRMIKGIKKGTFFVPGDPAIVKSHGYIHGLVDSVLFTMQKTDEFILYNYAENPCLPLGEMVEASKKALGLRRPVLRIPLPLLVMLSRVITLFYPKSPIHPVRVKKAAFPTNINPTYLIDNGFEFKYAFPQSLRHWLEKAPTDFGNK